MAARNYTILVTACGCPGGPSVVRALAPEFRVIGTDLDPAASGRFWCDAFYRTPAGNEPDFANVLLTVCLREGVDAVVPESSAEVLALAQQIGIFEEREIRVLVSSPGAVAAALDKAKTYQALEGSGVPVPRYRLLPETPAVADYWPLLMDAIHDMGFPRRPVVLKPPVGKGGRGIRFLVPETCRMEADLRQWPRALQVDLRDVQLWLNRVNEYGERYPRLLVMEYLWGDESSADTFDGYGQALGFTKIRRDCRNGIHFRHEAKHDPALMAAGQAVVEALGLEYFVNVQFMDGKLLEVNPRISTQILHGGFNLPALGVKLALGLIDGSAVTLPDGVRAQYFHDLQSYGPKDVRVGCRWL